MKSNSLPIAGVKRRRQAESAEYKVYSRQLDSFALQNLPIAKIVAF